MSTLMTLQRAAQLLGLPSASGDAEVAIRRVHTDTRTLQPGDLFVALKGERFDANDFLPQARDAGAVAALAHRGLAEAGLPGLQVPDTRLALIQLARAWRQGFQLPLIAITGSNGKTTVTQMVAAMLRAWRGDAALATQGNLNNDIGVPLTVLRLTAQHQVAVIELGMNHPGEIALLADIAQPTVVLVNNAQREHQEFMASIEAVAQENGAAITALPDSGIVVIPIDDDYTPLWQQLAGTRRVWRFGIEQPQADVYAGTPLWRDGAWLVQAHTPLGPVQYRLQVAGRHNVKNSLAALACALAAGVPLEAAARGLSSFEPVKGRSRALALQWRGHALTLVDDSYNANPDSVRAAIDVLVDLPAPRLLVLGDMGEVGERGPEFHAEVAAYALERGIDRLLLLGELTRDCVQAAPGIAEHFADIDSLGAALLARLPQAGSVLVKGSRFMKMERVVQAVTDSAPQPAEATTCS